MRRGWCFSFHRRGNWGKKQIWDLSSDPAHAPRTLHDLSLNWIFPRFSFIQTYWVFFSECFFRVSQPFCCQSLCFPFTGVVYNGKGCLALWLRLKVLFFRSWVGTWLPTHVLTPLFDPTSGTASKKDIEHQTSISPSRTSMKGLKCKTN